MSRVLIADDDKNIASACTNFLTNEKNIEVIDVVNNGKDALDSYMKNVPDVMILDLKMPDMSGLEVLDKLSNSYVERRKNNIIVISGSLMDLFPYNTAKIYRILPKPFEFDELIDTINEIQGIIDDDYLENLIDDLFKKLRLYILSSKGIIYLKQAVIFCYKDENLFYNMSNVYELIAEKNSIKRITPKTVLWSLESLINTYKKSVDDEFLETNLVYYDATRNMTPKYLIELIVIHLKSII